MHKFARAAQGACTAMLKHNIGYRTLGSTLGGDCGVDCGGCRPYSNKHAHTKSHVYTYVIANHVNTRRPCQSIVLLSGRGSLILSWQLPNGFPHTILDLKYFNCIHFRRRSQRRAEFTFFFIFETKTFGTLKFFAGCSLFCGY